MGLNRTRIKSRRKSVPKGIPDHWGRVAALGCCVCGQRSTIHHAHGGSIREKFGSQAMPGMAQRQNHWLVIPLCFNHHVGDEGIDNGQGRYKGVAQWELAFGSQASFLEAVRVIIWQTYSYDIYQKAGLAVGSVGDSPARCDPA